MDHTLIVYGTRRGTTEKTCEVIAETLILKHKHKVELTNIRKIRKFKKRLNEFDNLIIGSSIVRGRWKSRVLRFLKKNDFQNKSVALFVTAGLTMNKENLFGSNREEVRAEAIRQYIESYLEELSFVPVSKTAFGGVIVRSGSTKFNSWIREDIENWAKSIGDIFSKRANGNAQED